MSLRSARCAVAMATVLSAVAAQKTPSLEQRFATLKAELETDPRPPFPERVRRVEAFLREHETLAQRRPVLEATLLLARLQLQRPNPEAARLLFQSAADRTREADPTSHAAAQFGLYQAHLLASEMDEARAALRALIADHPRTDAAAAARIALTHLDRRTAIKVGDPLPPLDLGADVHGQTISPEALRQRPRLLVFWSPDHPASQRRLESLAAAWQAANQSAATLLAFALTDDVDSLRRQADKRQWKFQLLSSAESGYLHPIWVELGVRSIPTTLLIDADDTLLARDIAPDRLATMFGR